MHTITFTCETITPMFLSGADGQTPELRAPSIKGALRFWWRAMNGHLSLEELRKKEADLFGFAGNKNIATIRKSILLIRAFPFDGTMGTATEDTLPHRRDEKHYGHPSPAKCFDTGGKFCVVLTTSQPHKYSIQEAAALFELISFLGGFGKRVRRCMGAFKIIKKDNQNYSTPDSLLEHINGLLKIISPFFIFKNGAIFNDFSGTKGAYPCIKKIELGKRSEKAYRKILTRTGKTASDLKKRYTFKYEASLGHASKGRFASPVYVSVVEKNKMFLPIVTTFNTVPDRHPSTIDLALQEEFKYNIL